MMARAIVMTIWLACLMMPAVDLSASSALAAPPPKSSFKAPPPKAKFPPPKAKSPPTRAKSPPPKAKSPPPKAKISPRPPSPKPKSSSSVPRPTAPKPKAISPAKRPAPPPPPKSNGGCHDNSTSCTRFAALGYCTSRPVYMVGTASSPGNCLASCKKCPTGPSPAPAKVPRPAPRSPSPAGPTTGNTTILSLARSKACLMPNPVGGRLVILSTCDRSARQLWTWSTATHTLVHALSGLCLTYNSALDDDSAITLQACTHPVNKLQQWDYTPNALAPLTPLFAKDWCLHISNFTTKDGAPVKMWSCQQGMKDDSVAKYFLFALYPAKCADLSTQCATWSKQGRCQSDALYMVGDRSHYGHCMKSCGMCAVKPVSPSPRPAPRSNQPPRGGGAQGGCWSECPSGYTKVYLQQGLTSGWYCDRPAVVILKHCHDDCLVYDFATDSTVLGYCCDPCPDPNYFNVEDPPRCVARGDQVRACPAPPAPLPPASENPRYFKTLLRWYVDDTSALRQGWKADDNALTYMDGNVFLAAMILVGMPQVSFGDSDAEVAAVSQLSTQFMAPRGVVGDVKWIKIRYTRDAGNYGRVSSIYADPNGDRAVRAAVFRTDTDVFVLMPGESNGALTIDFPVNYNDAFIALNGGRYGSGTGDYATNFDTNTFPVLDGTPAEVAEGYYRALKVLLADPLQSLIMAALQELQPGWAPTAGSSYQGTGARVWFIGHGQGAGLALISSAYFFALGFPFGGAYLFGDTVVTGFESDGLRNWFIKYGLWNKVFRILNSNDVQSTLAPRYFHVGRTIFFCQGQMQTFDDYGEGSPRCTPDIGGLTLPHGTGDEYSNSAWGFVIDINVIKQNYATSLINLHAPAAYASSVLRAFDALAASQPPQVQVNLATLISTNAWPRDWLSSSCLTSADCTTRCGELVGASTCGAGYACGGSFQCILPPPPPPPCRSWFSC